MKTVLDTPITGLSLDELDQLERAIYQESSKTWDQICWELEPAKKSELKTKMVELNQKAQTVCAARFDLYGRVTK